MGQIQEQLQTWYASLGETSQKILVWVTLAVLALILYLLLWAPLAQDVELQEQRVATSGQDLHWLHEASAEVRALRGKNRQPLQKILPGSLKRHQLQAESNKYDAKVGEWRLRFKSADFRQLLLWLNELRSQSTVVIALADIGREPTGGVNAHFVLLEKGR